MTTNLITALILVGATNWTGYVRDSRELGLIETNHMLRVEYVEQRVVDEGEACDLCRELAALSISGHRPLIAHTREFRHTNEFKLLSVPTDRVVWREHKEQDAQFEPMVVTNWIRAEVISVPAIGDAP